MSEMMNPYVWRQRREDTLREAERKRRTFSVMWELGRMAGLLLKYFRRLEARNRARP